MRKIELSVIIKTLEDKGYIRRRGINMSEFINNVSQKRQEKLKRNHFEFA